MTDYKMWYLTDKTENSLMMRWERLAEPWRLRWSFFEQGD
jgi:hypothetical protein